MHKNLDLTKFFHLFSKNAKSGSSRKRKSERIMPRSLRIETLEERQLLSATASEYEMNCQEYSSFDLPDVMNDINIIELSELTTQAPQRTMSAQTIQVKFSSTDTSATINLPDYGFVPNSEYIFNASTAPDWISGFVYISNGGVHLDLGKGTSTLSISEGIDTMTVNTTENITGSSRTWTMPVSQGDTVFVYIEFTQAAGSSHTQTINTNPTIHTQRPTIWVRSLQQRTSPT